ncbi:ATP-dependent helicase [Brachybacterium aquaticum]|uniref:DNA 3'-5' helicase n=1 Tax=Brachybacterium aquaticum TaxID=1432564 RepID=A0A841AFK2_9MICO|nr:ATP-dependent DNA helicase [Brachybacterium aquaticum]MBB5831894.1 DNA helicase-2/ATP-dependent DNA helicase PcrA [Brachybacterium aquaticum]
MTTPPRPTEPRHTAPRHTAAELGALLEQPPPTAEQTAVIEAPLVPMLVVAGAGSGKTETMASRVVWLIANGIVEPRQVLGLTFTRKAAHELGERIQKRLAALAAALRTEGLDLPPGLERGGDELVGQRPVVHTYNGFALDLVREHALAVGIDPELTMMSTSASWQLAHEIVEGWDDSLDLEASPATLTAALLSLTSSLADHLVTPAQLEEHLREIRTHLSQIPLQVEGRRRTTPKEVAKVLTALDARLALIPLLERFAEIRTSTSSLDFADQVSLAARVAREVPAAGALARRMHRVVLLDEFQDTSVAQLRMLTDLFGPGHAACAVGDPQQAIYGWRGASAASLAGFARAFATDTQPVLQRTLSTSWRNDEAVLAVANRLAAPLREADAGIEIPELHPRPGAGEGAAEILEAADERAEARAIADWVLTRRAEDEPGAPPASAAVLVRARRQIPALVAGLEERGLVAEVVGLGGLLHRPEVADVRALLAAAHDPGRGDALMRLLTGSRLRLGARDLAVLGKWRDRMGSRRRGERGRPGEEDEAEAISLVDAVDDLPPEDWTDPTGRALTAEGRARLTQIQGMLREMRRLLPLPLPDLVTAATRLLEVDLALLETDPGSRALADLEAFRDHAAAFERTARRGGLGAYLDLLEISEDEEAGLAVTAAPETAHDPAAVTIVTMHSAKGLEWDLVAVAGLTEGTVPSYDLRRARTDETGRVRVPADGWLGKLASASVPTALRGDADTLPELAWAEADTQVDAEALIEDYRFAQGEESLREDRRLMYVAVTRARRRLLLTSAAWREGLASARPRSRYLTEAAPLVPDAFRTAQEVPEQNPLESERPTAAWPPAPGPAEHERDRAAALLAEAAAEAAASAEIAALAEVAAAPEDSPAEHRGGRSAVPALADPQLAELVRRAIVDLEQRAAAPVVHSPPRLSASQVVQQAKDPRAAAIDLLRPLPRRPSPAAARGTAFHAWLETRYGSASLLDLEDLAVLEDEAEQGPLVDARALREAFDASEWAHRSPLAVEQPVTTRIGEIAVRGIIDAVFADPEGSDGSEGVLIVDWKTGHMPRPAQLRERSLQLSLYRLAWHERTGLPLSRIRTAFHFVADGITHEVRRHPSRERIAAMLSGQE